MREMFKGSIEKQQQLRPQSKDANGQDYFEPNRKNIAKKEDNKD